MSDYLSIPTPALREAHLAASVFGLENHGLAHLRLSFCGTLKEIKEGIERIQWAIDPHAPNELFLGSRKLVRDWL